MKLKKKKKNILKKKEKTRGFKTPSFLHLKKFIKKEKKNLRTFRLRGVDFDLNNEFKRI
jgi:hypothetical protein